MAPNTRRKVRASTRTLRNRGKKPTKPSGTPPKRGRGPRNPRTPQKPAGSPTQGKEEALQGISQTLERLADKVDRFDSQALELLAERVDQMDKTIDKSRLRKKAKTSRGSSTGSRRSSVGSRGGRRGQRARSRDRRRPQDSSSSPASDSSSSLGDSRGRGSSPARKGRGRTRRRGAASLGRDSFSGSASGESSAEGDGVPPETDYWEIAAHTPGLPSWAIQRRRVARYQGGPGEVWGSSDASEGNAAVSSVGDHENPPGIHLSERVREQILDGYYVNVFKLIKPEGPEGRRERPKRDRKGRRQTVTERTFTNWLRGYQVYMGVVMIGYPERGWHLNNHLGNVLRAKVLGGDMAAIHYDEDVRKRASENAKFRWDLLHSEVWLVEVGPNIKGKGEPSRGSRWLGKRETAFRFCWEFNQGRCRRSHCKFDHNCEVCLGQHPKATCSRSTASQQPFRGGRPSTAKKGNGGSGNSSTAGGSSQK